MKEQYNPQKYWEQRLSKKLDLTTVGQLGLGIYNYWLYKARFRAMRRALRKLEIDVSGKSLIDVGVGSGAWIPFWREYKIHQIVGLDITSSSISTLKNQYPDLSFFQRDICSKLAFAQEGNFDIVTAFDVLFHITDDTGFSNAILNISRLVKYGGLIIMSDSFCSRPWGPFYHEYHRTFDDYLKEFGLVGLKPLYLEPIFIIMTTIICESDNAYERMMAGFTRVTLRLIGILSSYPVTEWMNHPIGCSLYLMDGLLRRITKTGLSLKILIAQKC